MNLDWDGIWEGFLLGWLNGCEVGWPDVFSLGLWVEEKEIVGLAVGCIVVSLVIGLRVGDGDSLTV